MSPPSSAPKALRVLVLEPYLYDTGPGQRFRIEQWARAIDPSAAQFEFLPFESETLHEILYYEGHLVKKAVEIAKCAVRRVLQLLTLARKADVVFIYREALPFGTAILERILHFMGKRIIYDFDDAIFLPNVSKANQAFQWLKRQGYLP